PMCRVAHQALSFSRQPSPAGESADSQHPGGLHATSGRAVARHPRPLAAFHLSLRLSPPSKLFFTSSKSCAASSAACAESLDGSSLVGGDESLVPSSPPPVEIVISGSPGVSVKK